MIGLRLKSKDRTIGWAVFKLRGMWERASQEDRVDGSIWRLGKEAEGNLPYVLFSIPAFPAKYILSLVKYIIACAVKCTLYNKLFLQGGRVNIAGGI